MDGEKDTQTPKRCIAPFCQSHAEKPSIFCSIHYDDYLRYREEAAIERAEERTAGKPWTYYED